LKLHQFFNDVARIFPTRKHGFRKGGRNLKISAKKVVFLVSFRAVKTKSHHSPKRFGKIH